MSNHPPSADHRSHLGQFEAVRSASRPGRKLQVALDTRELSTALAALREVARHVDIIEVGTVLCLSEGMQAVRAIRAAYPDHILLADIRVAEAGSVLSRVAFDAGADWVTLVSGAAPDVFPTVADIAGDLGRDVQVELSDGWTWDTVERCRELEIRHFVFHRSRDAEARGNLAWSSRDLESIERVFDMGGRVSVTGGMTLDELPTFADIPAEIFVAGRALYASSDPAASSAGFASAIAGLPALSDV